MENLLVPPMEVQDLNAIERNLTSNAMCADCGISYVREAFEVKTSFGWHPTAARCRECAEEKGYETRDA